MAPSLAELVDPRHTALVTQECQRGVIGDRATLPELAGEARRRGMIERAAALAAAARAAGVPVIHCVAERRADGRGSNINARVFMAMRKQSTLLPGSPEVEVIPEIGTEPVDIVLTRLHGLGPMGGTDLDAVLRNLGVSTVVGVGVSVNVGMLDLAFDVVNAGYQMVMPTDAVAGVPADYAAAVLENTVSLVATLPTAAEVIEVWKGTSAS